MFSVVIFRCCALGRWAISCCCCCALSLMQHAACAAGGRWRLVGGGTDGVSGQGVNGYDTKVPRPALPGLNRLILPYSQVRYSGQYRHARRHYQDKSQREVCCPPLFARTVTANSSCPITQVVCCNLLWCRKNHVPKWTDARTGHILVRKPANKAFAVPWSCITPIPTSL